MVIISKQSLLYHQSLQTQRHCYRLCSARILYYLGKTILNYIGGLWLPVVSNSTKLTFLFPLILMGVIVVVIITGGKQSVISVVVRQKWKERTKSYEWQNYIEMSPACLNTCYHVTHVNTMWLIVEKVLPSVFMNFLFLIDKSAPVCWEILTAVTLFVVLISLGWVGKVEQVYQFECDVCDVWFIICQNTRSTYITISWKT